MEESLRQVVQRAYERYTPHLIQRGRMILGSTAGAEDALHDTFVNLVRAINSGKVDLPRLSLAWLYRVNTNICLNMKRKSARLALDDGFLDSCEQEQRNAELMMALNRLLSQIPSRLRGIAVFRYVDEMSSDEIAEVTGMSRRTTQRRLQQLRQWLAKRAPQVSEMTR